ncbi:MAG TPA: hypothetical protein VLG49_07085 [Rhabdochlamydiaceae bacterium]|nr:hypothetical protein [Rhabdochlamydiaceae bacterium]HSX13086.1 hypothetical protein [Chlamydiales bacterium]
MTGRTEVSSLTLAYQQEFLPPEGMESFPREVILGIFIDYLGVKTQAICCLVSKKWNAISQKNLNEIGVMVSIFNKSIPAFIGYDYETRNELKKQLAKEKSSDDFDEQHAMTFEGKVDENGSIVLKPQPRTLRAVALEFDPILKERANMSSEKNGDFAIKVVWKKIISNFDAGIAQLFYIPLPYDCHTYSVHIRENLSIVPISESVAFSKILHAASVFLNQRPIVSIAGPNSSGLFDAEIWSKPLLKEKNYTYI